MTLTSLDFIQYISAKSSGFPQLISFVNCVTFGFKCVLCTRVSNMQLSSEVNAGKTFLLLDVLQFLVSLNPVAEIQTDIVRAADLFHVKSRAKVRSGSLFFGCVLY